LNNPKEKLLKVDHLEKRFGQRRVLTDVSFHIPEGGCYTLFGANGSGKTTLAFLIASLLKPTGGAITYGGTNIHKQDARYRASVGLLTHSSFLYEDLSGYENLQFFGALYGVRNLTKTILQLASRFDIEPRLHEPTRALSRGLKQRLSIMRALINDPEIIILDEPFTGLDESSAQELHTLLVERQKAGKRILITTHNLHRGYESATKIGILANGRIQFESSRDEISFRDLEHTYTHPVHHETN
jgi:heme exporter protein A